MIPQREPTNLTWDLYNAICAFGHMGYLCARNDLVTMGSEWTRLLVVARGGIEPPTRGFSVQVLK